MCSPPLLTQVTTAADLGPGHPNLSAWVSLVVIPHGNVLQLKGDWVLCI